jgi:nitric oxide reductase NorD protein
MHGRHNPLTTKQIQESLDNLLGLILSERRTTAAQAAALARCTRQQQEWVLDWTKTLMRENVEMAYQFSTYAPKALALICEKGLEDWVTETLEVYDKNGLQAAITHLQTIETYAATYQRKNACLALEDIQNVLQTFLTGLDGRRLKLANSEITFTDTQTLFLPTTLNRFVKRDNNFFLYKAMAVHLWAQTWFGTWRRRLSTATAHFSHRDKAIHLFHTLERLRLDACIARELPGMSRDMGQLLTLFSEPQIPTGWEKIAQRLALPTATVDHSYELLETVYTWKVPAPVCYQGILLPEQVEPIMELRQAREKNAFQAELAQLCQTQNSSTASNSQAATDSQNLSDTPNNSHQGTNASSSTETTAESSGFRVEQQPNITHSEPMTPILTLDGQPLSASENLKKVMDSILQDLGKLPEDYLLSPGSGKDIEAIDDSKSKAPLLTQVSEENVFLYPEWDYRRQRYYKNWCVLREVEVPLESEQFITDTLQHYRGLLKTLRRSFEALRGGNLRLKKQPFGEDIDIDALIATYADAQSGLEMSQHVFTKMHKIARDIGVIFMIDMSASTKGWINQAARESLVLLCEVLETLGDRYAIYGFSGMTRKRCEIYPIKRFEEAYNITVRQRISGIAPQEYTRMGVAIRHLTGIFKQIDSKIKILITLSDGKPNDEGDNYRGTYGIEDTRQALLEAKREGIYPFCITIDTEAKLYLPRMYGAVNYTVIDKVQQLPLKVSDIYRKLTT